ncbi:hypothetical protein HDU97_007270 [Phlyctochytrium planicorne]|nr:hypothetical protein HDU97_007270 [Phlyctochytrium planicorne]
MPGHVNAAPQAKLVQLHVFFRHGDRSPVRTIAPFENIAWRECSAFSDFVKTKEQEKLNVKRVVQIPSKGYFTNLFFNGTCNLGQLTDKGHSQMRILGEKIKAAYFRKDLWISEAVASFKNEEYFVPTPEFIAVRSTDVWRTLQSAQSLLKGIWNESDQPSEPFPIFVRPRPIDPLSVQVDTCPRLKHLHSLLRRGKLDPNSRHYDVNTVTFTKCGESFEAAATLLRNNLNQILGSDHLGNDATFDIETWLDVVRCRTCHGKDLPCSLDGKFCVNKALADSLFKLAGWWIRNEFEAGWKAILNAHRNDETAAEKARQLRQEDMKLRAGPILAEILAEMLKRTKDTDGAFENQARIFFYSAHDLTLAALLGVLDADDRRWPPYASSLIFELWGGGKEFFIRIVYNGRPVPLRRWPSGKKLIVYHTNWSCYGRNYQVKDLPINFISDINYCFLDLRPNPEGHLIPTLTDPWADIDKRYTQPGEGIDPPDSWNDDPNCPSYYGNFGQFMKLKKKGAKFNLGLSVGGWTLSKRFSTAVRTPPSREAFVTGMFAIFDKYPGLFNRVDIDWEHISPVGKNYGEGGNEVHQDDPANFSAFLHLLRQRLDATGRGHFEISACVVADPAKMEALPLSAMSQTLTTINVMTYDFASSAWGPCPAGHQTNLSSTPYSPLSVELAVDELIRRGVPPHKIVIGAAFYSRAFANTEGLGQPSSGVSSDKSWEDGICDYKVLPRPGATEYWDEKARATYSYDPVKKILSSYDSVQSVKEKAQLVHQKGLAVRLITHAASKLLQRLYSTHKFIPSILKQQSLPFSACTTVRVSQAQAVQEKSLTPRSSPSISTTAVTELKRMLDLGKNPLESWRLYRAIATSWDFDSSELQSLSVSDINQLMAIAVSGYVQRTPNAQKSAIEELFRLLVEKNSDVGFGSDRVPNAESIHFVLEARSRFGDVEGMISLLEIAQKSKLSLSQDQVALDALACYGRAGRFAEAEYVLERIVAANSPLAKKTAEELDLEADLERQRRKAARRLHENSVIAGAGFDIESEGAEDISVHKAKRSDSLRKFDLNPAVEHFLPVLSEIVRKPPLPADAPKALVQRRANARPRLHRGNILRAYNTLLHAYARGGHREQCDFLLATMQTSGPKPINESYSAAMMAARRDNDQARLEELEKKASEAGVHWSRVLNNHVLEAAIATGDPFMAKEALDLLRKRSDEFATKGMKGPDVHTLLAMVKVAGLARDPIAAWSAFAQLLRIRGRDISPTTVACYVAHAVGPLRDANLWDSYAKAADLKAPSVNLYRLGLLGYATLGDLASSEILSKAFEDSGAQRLKKIGSRSYPTTALRLAVSKCTWDETKVRVHEKALGLLIQAASRHGRALPAGLKPFGDTSASPVAFFETLVSQRGVQPSSKSVNLLIEHLCAQNTDEVNGQLIQGLVLLMKEKTLQKHDEVLEKLVDGFGKESEIVEIYSSL